MGSAGVVHFVLVPFLDTALVQCLLKSILLSFCWPVTVWCRQHYSCNKNQQSVLYSMWRDYEDADS